MENAKITYNLLLTKPPVEGKEVKLTFTLDELEEFDISSRLIEDGHYDSMGWPTDYYKVLNREIEIFNDLN